MIGTIDVFYSFCDVLGDEKMITMVLMATQIILLGVSWVTVAQ